jgi:XTP/dITP diphosphohydrolase
MPTLVLATQNPGKVRELESVLRASDLDIDIKGLADLGADFPEPTEDGGSFLANATIKATAYARATGLPCLADDSGLEIDHLEGQPGVNSSHYAVLDLPQDHQDALSREQRDAKNIDKVLDELDAVPLDDRTARFVCTMVLATPAGEILATSQGTFEGRIGLPPTDPHATPSTTVPRGDHGFGYDPIFLIAPDHDRTSAQLDPAEKNTISHRAKALSAMIERLRAIDLP